MKAKILLGIVMLLVLTAGVSAAVPSWDELSAEEQKAIFNADLSVTELKKNNLASSTVSPIAVNDPFASAGTPVKVQFELKNVGEGFPLNQISLPPNVFALVVSVDREIGYRTADGREIDVFSKMSGLQKFMYLTSIGVESAYDATKGSIQGRQCGFIDVFDNLPKSTQEEIREENGGKAAEVYSWDCLKVTSEENFDDRVKSYCEDTGYTSQCLAELNRDNANALTNTVVALLVEDDDLKTGECELARGNTAVGWLAKSTLRCDIGPNGVQPGESVTFEYYIVVPADTPSVNPEEFAESQNEISESRTYQASCLDSDYPRNCHTIYGGVFPVQQDNLLSVLADNAQDLTAVGQCSWKQLWNLGDNDFTSCVRSRSAGVDTVGEPVWEGQGTFYVLGPDLDATVTLILIVAGMLGGLGGLATSRQITG